MADVSFNDWKISRKLAAGFAFMVVVIAATGGITSYNISQLTKTRLAFSEARDVLASVAQANFLLARQENSLRGYLITLDPYYLERAAAHRDNFGKALDTVRGQVAENPEALKSVDLAKTAASDWYV
jgi:methyl-accepting chemotaxis protein